MQNLTHAYMDGSYDPEGDQTDVFSLPRGKRRALQVYGPGGRKHNRNGSSLDEAGAASPALIEDIAPSNAPAGLSEAERTMLVLRRALERSCPDGIVDERVLSKAELIPSLAYAEEINSPGLDAVLQGMPLHNQALAARRLLQAK